MYERSVKPQPRVGSLDLNFLPWSPDHPCEENEIEKNSFKLF